MLRTLSVRNFAVVEALEVEFERGFTVLTGETGAGKSILVGALALLLGERFDALQLRAGADRAELAATFDPTRLPAVKEWLDAEGIESGDELLLRRVHDAQGRSRAWVNGTQVTLARLSALGALLVDLHGQHAHQALLRPEPQRQLVDAFAGATALANEVARAWREHRDAEAASKAADAAEASAAAERNGLASALDELEALALAPDEWAELDARQRRFAHAKFLQEVAGEASEALTEGDHALSSMLARVRQRIGQGASIDPALAQVDELLAPASIQIDEAARALRDYLRRQDLDPRESERTERRIAAVHETARKHRVRPDELPALAATIRTRLEALRREGDATALRMQAESALRRYDALAAELSARRHAAGADLGARVTETMQVLAMKGGHFAVSLDPLPDRASFGRERVGFVIATHPKQSPGAFARIASGGELARIALAIQVAASGVTAVPTLVFDEVDSGIGGAVAATVGRLLQALANGSQVLCVTHLAQVAAHADHHFRVVKASRPSGVSSSLQPLANRERVDELARMLAGSEVTPKTLAHAGELYRKHRPLRRGQGT